MQTNKIRKIIRETIRFENETGTYINAIKRTAAQKGIQISAKQCNERFELLKEYIEHAPALIDQICSAAQKAGVFNQVSPVLEIAENYFLEPMDIIPDQLGLLGLLDDADIVQSIIQALSEIYRQQTGYYLLPVDLTEINQAVRKLFGEPVASTLDEVIASALSLPAINQFINIFSSISYPFIDTPDPIWGNISMKERVDIQMGALGIF